jgi:hypothetical protein
MAKKPSVPCTRCGRLLWSGPTTVPDDQRVCRACRRGEIPVPEVGQVWVSDDPRRPDVRFKIVWFDGQVAVCTDTQLDRPRRIPVDRLRPGVRGYRLLFSADGLAVEQ